MQKYDKSLPQLDGVVLEVPVNEHIEPESQQLLWDFLTGRMPHYDMGVPFELWGMELHEEPRCQIHPKEKFDWVC